MDAEPTDDLPLIRCAVYTRARTLASTLAVRPGSVAVIIASEHAALVLRLGRADLRRPGRHPTRQPAVPLAPVAGLAEREEVLAVAAPLEAEHVVVHGERADAKNLLMDPRSSIVLEPSSTRLEGPGGEPGPSSSFRRPRCPPMYGINLGVATFLPIDPDRQGATGSGCR